MNFWRVQSSTNILLLPEPYLQRLRPLWLVYLALPRVPKKNLFLLTCVTWCRHHMWGDWFYPTAFVLFKSKTVNCFGFFAGLLDWTWAFRIQHLVPKVECSVQSLANLRICFVLTSVRVCEPCGFQDLKSVPRQDGFCFFTCKGFLGVQVSGF